VLAHDFTVLGECGQSRVVVIPHQSGITDDIGTQNRCQLAFDVGIGHFASLAKDELRDDDKWGLPIFYRT
jgi:hypothetical protein